MGGDILDVMDALGYQTFLVAGHDRGGRVAYRRALDHPERVGRLAVLDIVPTLDMWEQIEPRTAVANWHWLLLARAAPLPERLIGCDPAFFGRYILDDWSGQPGSLHPDAVAEYLRHFSKPSVIAAACEDYRAGATVDLALDRADRAAGRRMSCPTLLLWSKRFLHTTPSPPAIWNRWTDRLTEISLECGHFIPEEAPAACGVTLSDFFGGDLLGEASTCISRGPA